MAKKRADYRDVLAAPANRVAEILSGDLYLSPRPAGPHLHVAGELYAELRDPFRRGRGGPGGWVILLEPEVHLGHAAQNAIVVPDLAGWHKQRLVEGAQAVHFVSSPDWVCEVLSPSTESLDRSQKRDAYAAAGVPFLWLIDPIARYLEVLSLRASKYVNAGTFHKLDRVRAAPFDSFELDLAALWIEP